MYCPQNVCIKLTFPRNTRDTESIESCLCVSQHTRTLEYYVNTATQSIEKRAATLTYPSTWRNTTKYWFFPIEQLKCVVVCIWRNDNWLVYFLHGSLLLFFFVIVFAQCVNRHHSVESVYTWIRVEFSHTKHNATHYNILSKLYRRIRQIRN